MNEHLSCDKLFDMPLAQQKPRLYTHDEYLKLERHAGVRHEYLNGEIFEMAGANKRHNTISVNLIHLLVTQIRGRECNIYGSDMRIKIPTAGSYTYPDVVALRGREEFEDETEDTL